MKYTSKPTRPSFTNFDSFLNPNATCPVCREAVYFYQSPYGGRVFFDTLFPDWDKHPCTDNSSYRYGTHTFIKPIKVVEKIPKWQIDEWQPLEILRVYQEGKWWVVSAKIVENGQSIRLLVNGKPLIEPHNLAAFSGWNENGIALLSCICQRGEETSISIVFRYLDYHAVLPSTTVAMLVKLLKKEPK